MEVISLLEVVDSVAGQVPLPEDWVNATVNYAEVPERTMVELSRIERSSKNINGLMSGFLDGLFKSAYRDSQAAGALDCYLDRVDANGLNWFDLGPTGWAKESTQARTEGLEILVHMSRYFERYAKAYHAGRFNGWPKVHDLDFSEGRFSKKEDLQRLREIGFERPKLIEFLNHIGIPHSLQNENPVVNYDQDSILKSDQPISTTETGPVVVDMVIFGKENQNGNSEVHRIHSSKHVLADIINDARLLAGDKRDDARTVYAILTQMAKRDNPPIPLLKFEKGNGIQYQSGEILKFYKQDALRKFLNPSARGPKKKSINNGDKY